MDFYQIKEKTTKSGVIEIYPDFKIGRSNDLMIRSKSFYAIWDDQTGVWSTDEYDVQRLVDAELLTHKQELSKRTDASIHVKLMSEFSTKSWAEFRSFMGHISDNAHQLDEDLTFSNTEVTKKDYVSKRLPYPLQEGKCDAYEEIISVLYDPEEREKIEWAIGAIISGDAKKIQKFIVLYGEAGAGKSTILNIIQNLFEGYYTTFEAKALTSSNNSFSTEVFKANPLVAIQHDGDLSKIEDNTKLNSIVSHEEMTMNEKYKPSYTSRINSFLFMATNKPVKITDGKSGIIRRLIDVRPSGRKIPTKRYFELMAQTKFELGAIAFHCREVYLKLGKNYYATYRPLDMMYQTDVFFNFVESNYYIFKEQNYTTLAQGYDMYKFYCDEALIDFKLPRHKFREELKNYFKEFHEISRVEGKQVRSCYSGFLIDKFKHILKEKEEPAYLVLNSTKSILDEIYKDLPAQYATEDETPISKWAKVNTTLKDLDTRKVHYLKLPENHIVIDFDLKENEEKSKKKNLEAASNWPPTYSEFSKSGNGVHLHYIYEGDVTRLKRLYEDDIEIKVFSGNSSLRRKLSKCNELPIATINSGLPLKGEKMINFDAVKSEKGLRALIKRNLNKEFHPGTKPSIDFIYTILEDAYNSELTYDVSDMRPEILAFANNSSNKSEYCVKLVSQMKFVKENEKNIDEYETDELVFFDVEVFPNLFIVVWKKEGKKPVKMINPKASDIENLMKFKLVGFNCRRYDNHILYARYIGYDNLELFKLSQKIINNSRNALFGEAYNVSYTDIYDFSSVKQSLKKFQIELGIHHKELGMKWEEPVPEDMWDTVVEYCVNDVVSTEEVFKSRYQDFVARQILADLSGLTVNDTTQAHTAKIIFGDDNKPQEKFVYTNLSEMFPGYVFDEGKSIYRNEETGEGGYVYSEPGMYNNVALLDIASMHPTSLINMNMFGVYTKNFKELIDARIAIKHKNYKSAKKMLNGALEKYLDTDENSEALSYALKIVINIVYGLTSAKFDNKFKDSRNIDNIVAKRGALFMVDLKHEVQDRGFTVAHIKTDSIKIPNATPDIIQFVMEFGKKYGYTFEHEATFDRFCLVNDAVYIAKHKGSSKWVAVGAQFSQPYVFKTLFSKEKILFDDLCESKSVTTALYLDMNEDLPEDDHRYHFIGKTGLFCPIKTGAGGGVLLREKEGRYYAANGSKGYRWLEAEVVKALKKEKDIDFEYFEELVETAIKDISKFGDFDIFVDEKINFEETPPWLMPCGSEKYKTCFDCPKFQNKNTKCGLGYDLTNVILKGEKK